MKKMSLQLLAGIFVALCFAPVVAAETFEFDSTPGRLPKSVVPIHYDMRVKPDVETATFEGTQTITIDVRKATASVQLNTHDITVSIAKVDGKAATATTDNDKQLTTISLKTPLKVGRHKLTMTFAGKMLSSPEGLFLQPYRAPDGTTLKLVSTQFEATDARRMFPSFDEPAFKATFQLTALIPKSWTAISNMPIEKKSTQGELSVWRFKKSPKMASYLVELTAGDMAQIGDTSEGVDQIVYATRGNEQYGKDALVNSKKVLSFFNDYFGTKYPLPKLAHIAIPGGFGGAMENWGAIVYNEETLLHTPTTEEARLPRQFGILAHETAHQWFGDLVTMAWWNDIWLNESFAEWMATKATAALNPQWAIYENSTGEKNRALVADARSTSHPIQQEIKDEAQAMASFDPAITYSKGQSILQMLEGYIGEDAFRTGIRAYMKKHAYSNTVAADLWQALAVASGKPVAQIAENWITRPGFPLISVSAACDAAGNRTLTLTQSRFLSIGSDDRNTVWQVPIAIALGVNGPPNTILLSEKTGTAPGGRCDEPLRVGAGDRGYYRVAYDDKILAVNRKAFVDFPPLDQIGMLDDTWARVQSGQDDIALFLVLAESLGNKFNPTVRARVASVLGSVEANMRGTPSYAKFQAYGRSQLLPTFKELGWTPKPGESLETKNLRLATLLSLGLLNDPEIRAEASRRFEKFLAARTSLSVDEQATVLNIVANSADDATYEKILSLAKNAKDASEAGRYFGALAQARATPLVNKTMEITLQPIFPPEATKIPLFLIGGLADHHHQEAWSFFQKQDAALLKPFSQFERSMLVAQMIPQIFWRIDEAPVEAYLKKNIPESVFQYAKGGMEAAAFRRSQVKRLNEQTEKYLASK